ncbi:MAG: ABC transporter substrate-binding protein [Candidatus Geothermincolia bacterium]
MNGSRARTCLLVTIVTGAMLLSLIALPGCGTSSLTLGTTTSLQQSGLLARIIPGFEKQYNVKVTVVAKSKAADVLKLGEQGKADVLLVNSREGVKTFVENKKGTNEKDIMYGDLVVVGPAADPAQIKGLDCPGKSSKKIAAAGATYVCMGGDSDINNKVMGYFKKNNIDAAGQPWFTATGAPMTATLKVASDKQGYVIADRLTWLANQNKLDLVMLVQGCTMLYDQYTAVVVNPANRPEQNFNTRQAGQFVDYLASDSTQKQIASFTKYGSLIYSANAPGAATQSGSTTTAPSSTPNAH